MDRYRVRGQGWRSARRTYGRVRRLGMCVALGLGLIPVLGGLPAQAATLTVCPSGPPTCQYAHIQDAINAASPGDTITIAAGTYAETLGIPTSLTLTGAGAGNTIVDGHQSGTVVTVGADANVTISGVTIQNGYGSSYGGGVNNAGTLALNNSTISGNSVNVGVGYGGGIYSTGMLTLNSSTVSGNSAPAGNGGGIWSSGLLSLTNSTVSNDSASGINGSSGGGIYNTGALTLNNSTISGNGVTCGSPSTECTSNGGGISTSGTLTVTNSIISGNSTSATGFSDGGGVYNQGVVTLASSTVISNSATCSGTLGGCTSAGGGIDSDTGATLNATNSTLAGNTTHCSGRKCNSNGGGLFTMLSTATLTGSTLTGNTATGPSGSGNGGGIYNGGTTVTYGGTLTLNNSTLAGNGAGFAGGGIYNWQKSTVYVTDSTVSGNSALGGSGGGILNNLGGQLTLSTTILAKNTTFFGDPDCFGAMTSGGYNLVGISDGCSGLSNGLNGDQVGSSGSPIDPLVGPLQNNGGPTQTMALLSGSPAIDWVAASHCALAIDQRGQPRPDEIADNGVCDIGAYEAQLGPPATLVVSLISGVPFQTVTLTGTNFGASEAVKLLWDSTTTPPLTTSTTLANGSFVVQVRVPQATAGGHAFIADGQNSGRSAGASFTVKPAVFLSPNHGKAGSVATMIGVGFGQSETVAALWYPGFKVLKSGPSNAVGTVSMSFTVPLSPTGAYDVIGYGLTTKQHAIAPFQVTATSMPRAAAQSGGAATQAEVAAQLIGVSGYMNEVGYAALTWRAPVMAPSRTRGSTSRP